MFRKIKNTAIQKNFDLKNACTFHIGGNARYFIKCYTIVALKRVVKICLRRSIHFKVIGNGSNLLFDDKGFNGAIIKFCDKHCCVKGQTMIASSGVDMADMIAVAKTHSLSGLENFVGIPCTLGGAIYNNLGANNVEISSLIDSVVTFKIKNCKSIKQTNINCKKHKNYYQKKHINNCKIFTNNCNKIYRNNYCKKHTNNYCKNINKLLINKKPKIIKNTYKILENSFSYRKNNFINKNEIIIGAKIKLISLNKNIVQKNIINNYSKKYNSQPLNNYSAGSVFKRGQNFLPAKIIDELGLKGTKVGGAEISQKHAGFIINTGNATSTDVITLINLIKQRAKDVYNYEFEEEIEYVPPTNQQYDNSPKRKSH